jgi:fructose-bisphosphate aldolase class II
MVKTYFNQALEQGFAIGAFNFVNLELLKAILQASQETNAPVIASVSEGALRYIGANHLKSMIKTVKEENKYKVIFHLDHGTSFDSCKNAIELGFDSVMIDASSLPFEQNITLTKQVVDYAHSKGVFVEGELGVLQGVEDDIVSNHSVFTNPMQAKEFVKRTNVDSLAIAIGTSHGAHKFAGEPKLSMEILYAIEELMPNFPLVLHGASSVYQSQIEHFNSIYGELKDAKGVTDEILTEVSTKHNICKINTDTDLRICFLANLKQSMKDKPSEIDIRKHLLFAQNKTKELIKHKIKILGFDY